MSSDEPRQQPKGGGGGGGGGSLFPSAAPLLTSVLSSVAMRSNVAIYIVICSSINAFNANNSDSASTVFLG